MIEKAKELIAQTLDNCGHAIPSVMPDDWRPVARIARALEQAKAEGFAEGRGALREQFVAALLSTRTYSYKIPADEAVRMADEAMRALDEEQEEPEPYKLRVLKRNIASVPYEGGVKEGDAVAAVYMEDYCFDRVRPAKEDDCIVGYALPSDENGTRMCITPGYRFKEHEEPNKASCNADPVKGGCDCCNKTGVVQKGMVEMACHCLEGLM